MTVKHIAETAHINRGTFYLHFLDKYDLMDHIQNELTQELSQRIILIQPAAVFAHISNGKLYPPFIAIFQYIESQRAAFSALLGVNGDPAFRNKLKLIFSSVLLGKLTVLDATITEEELKPYIHSFLTSAILGIFEEWLEKKTNHKLQRT